MKISFHKYQGTGNDFIMLNNMNNQYDDLSIAAIQKLCDRKFGIGADGLIKINKHAAYDFEMDYYNADGSKSFCGNGARCTVEFARSLGLISEKTQFYAIDGLHEAFIKEDLVHLAMKNVDGITEKNQNYIVQTGSPHFIKLVNNLSQFDIVGYGKEVRYSNEYKKEGINVNAIEVNHQNEISIRTYERGVEDETLSCGTGATAAALVYSYLNNSFGEQEITVHVQGGELTLKFNRISQYEFNEIYLIGPAIEVFYGEINL